MSHLLNFTHKQQRGGKFKFQETPSSESASYTFLLCRLLHFPSTLKAKILIITHQVMWNTKKTGKSAYLLSLY